MIRVLWLAMRQSERMSQLSGDAGSGVHVTQLGSITELLMYTRHSLCDVAVITGDAEARTDDMLLAILRADSSVPVIIDSPGAGTDDVIRLVRLGAFHIWTGATGADRVVECIESAAARRRAHRPQRNEEKAEPWRDCIVGESEPMRRVLDVIRLVAARRSSVLITGETGTGKEVVARALHQAGGRRDLPFVAVNCSAIPENLVEAELFGYVRGAFTGAVQSRPGKFEQAEGGTIFLDEVGELPLDMQAKLLRVLQEREVQRIGSSETVRLNVRVIAATNANLEEAIARRTFREDLYYRLNVVPMHLPALRERRSDIPALARFFLERICTAEGIPQCTITPSGLQRLSEFPWPGNVRQLEHAIEMAVVLCGDRETLDASDFPVLHGSRVQSGAPVGESETVLVTDQGLDFEETVSRFERAIVQQALLRCGGNKARAAQLLRMKRTTLLARMKTLESRFAPMALAGHACA